MPKPKTKVKITVTGHQIFNQFECTLLRVCESVEKFDDKYLQVPALVVEDDDGIAIINLKQRWKDVAVEYIKPKEELELAET